MTATEKAIETRKRNAELRKKRKESMIFLKEKMIETCKSIMNDPNATPADKIRAVENLREITKGW